jgi:hypothetical protein
LVIVNRSSVCALALVGMVLNGGTFWLAMLSGLAARS